MRGDSLNVRLSSKGQIVIPAGIRKTAGLRAGDVLHVRTTERGEIVFATAAARDRWIEGERDRFAEWARRTGRDPVREFEQRRRTERRREASRHAARGA